MTEENKNVKKFPNLRFPGFEGEWEVKKLGETFSIFNGYAFSSNASVDNGNLWVKIADVGIQEMKRDNISFLPFDFKEKYSKFILEKGDYVVALTRPILSGKLKIAKIDDFFNGSLLNQRVGKIQTNNHNGFIYYTLQRTPLIKEIENNIAGSDPPNLSPNEINSISIKLPVISEQQKIANFLEIIDTRIQTQKKIIEKLETLMKVSRANIFSQKFRFKDEKGNYFPDWKLQKLGDLGIFFSGGTPLTSNRKYYQGKIPFIKSGEINATKTEQFISEEALKNSSAKIVNVGDILYALYGATSGEVGISKLNGAINQAILCIRTEINNLFLLNYLKLKKENILNTYLQGGQGNLSSEIIKSLSIPVPYSKEQEKIANFLSFIQEKIETEKQISEKLELQKKFLLANLFV